MKNAAYYLKMSESSEKERPCPGRRFRLNQDRPEDRKRFDTTGEIGRHNGSRPPPACEGKPEYQVSHTMPDRHRVTGKSFRLWSKNETR